jgi:ABC-type glycerol-3-phosphate transport system permease component
MSSQTLAPRQKASGQYRRERRITFIAANLFLIFYTLVALYPLFMMILNSFKTESEILSNSAYLPQVWSLENYQAIFKYHGGLWRNFVVSAVVSTISTVTAVLLAAMAAFAFAKYEFKGRNLLFALLLATMMVPGEITVPTLYIIFSKLGWLNTYQGLIVPTVTSVFGLFMMRQYMLSVPTALIEAARIDGANHWQLFWKIMAPISAPVLGAFAIIHFLGVWNSYLWPLIVSTKREIQPIMVVLPNMTDPIIGFLPVWGTIMAGCVLATMPIVIVFIAFQDKFMAGVVVGAVKG